MLTPLAVLRTAAAISSGVAWPRVPTASRTSWRCGVSRYPRDRSSDCQSSAAGTERPMREGYAGPPRVSDVTALGVLTPDGPVLIDPTTPILRADDLGVLRGESVFETMRIAGGRVRYVDAHLRRLAGSADRMAITLPAGIQDLVEAVDTAYESADGVLRVVCSKGVPGEAPVAFALAYPIAPEAITGRHNGVRVITLSLGVSAAARASAPWLLGG